MAVTTVALASPVVSAREFSPYVLMSDPLPANPASRPGQFLVLSAGPVSADAESSLWNAGQVAALVRFLQSEDANVPDGLGGHTDLRLGVASRASLSLFGIDLSYSPVMMTANGSVSDDLLEAIRAQRASEMPSRNIELGANGLQMVVWQEFAVRAAFGVPVLPRLLGLQGLVLGGSVHWITGRALAEFRAEGQFQPGLAPSGNAKLSARSAERGSGLAYDIGLVAHLSRWLSVETAYVGAGQIRWEDVRPKETCWPSSCSTPPPAVSDYTYELPASTVLAFRLRPIGLVELLLGYARIGVNKEDGFARLNGELTLNLPLLQPSLGLVQDDGEPGRLYAKLHLGFGGTGITVKAVNLEGIGNPEQARSLGLSALVSLGI